MVLQKETERSSSMGDLKPQWVEGHAQGHTAGETQSWDLNAGLFLNLVLFPLCSHGQVLVQLTVCVKHTPSARGVE